MEAFYATVFAVLACLTGGLVFTQSRDGGSGGSAGSSAFLALRNNYIFVYALMMGKPLASRFGLHHQQDPAPWRGLDRPDLGPVVFCTRPQLETGCRAPTSTLCTSTTASASRTLGASSSQVFARCLNSALIPCLVIARAAQPGQGSYF
jgi:hypothetical protein